MSQLETNVAPILTPLIEGRSVTLSYTDVRVLQAWATKTALNFAFDAEKTFAHPIPQRLGHDLFAHRGDYEPVEDGQVWLSTYNPLGQFAYRHMAAQGYGNHPDTNQFHSVLRVVYIVGHAVFYVRLPDSLNAQGLGWRDPLPQFTPLHEVEDNGEVGVPIGSLNDLGISSTFNLHINGGIDPDEDLNIWAGLPS